MSTNGNDIASILGKGLVGAIPFVGPLAAEVVGAIIPNQRMDRIESLLKALEAKIGEQDHTKVREKICTPESVDLIEDGFIQASRALTPERQEYIAALLKNSLTDDQLKHIEYKRLLSTLQEVNDLQILMLKSYVLYRGEAEFEEFWAANEEALTPPEAYMGSSQENIDRNTIYKTHRQHLANLGLLKQNFKKPKRGDFPEFDEKTGMIKSNGFSITAFGRLLLRSIDQGGEF